MVSVEMKIGKNCDILKYVITIIIIVKNSKSNAEKLQAPFKALVFGDQTTLMALDMVGKITGALVRDWAFEPLCDCIS